MYVSSKNNKHITIIHQKDCQFLQLYILHRHVKIMLSFVAAQCFESGSN